MKTVVPIKMVASVDEEFELLDGSAGIHPGSLDWALNEWDAFSLEAGLLIHESAAGAEHELIVVTVGDEDSEEGLLACLAKGADRAVRVWDEQLPASDPLVVARALAGVVERESPDLVLCGVQSSDAVNGATGVALAGYLDLPHVAVVKRVAWGAEQRTLTVDRELEGGLIETLRIALPALLTIQTGSNEPRYATLRAIKQAANKPLEVCTPGQLGIEAAELAAAAGSALRALRPPERRAAAEMLDGSAAEVATRILEIVHDRMSG